MPKFIAPTAEANGVTLGVEHLGDTAAPLVLLAGGTTMLSWPDALWEALAADVTSCGTTCVTAARRPPSIPGSEVHATGERQDRP